MDEQYIAFTLGLLGFFECKCMPFGLCNALTTFQQLMQNYMGMLNLTYCLIYLDNVITFSKDEDNHLNHMRVIFDRFWAEHLKLKPSKCNLFCDEITYLTHCVTKDRIQPSEEHIKAIINFPESDSYMSIWQFVGMLAPSQKAREAFNLLKQALLKAPVLKFADYSKPFVLETDASSDGLGAVLLQEGEDGKLHPITYGSQSLTKAERNYHLGKAEFLSLKWAITGHFKEYLVYKPFVMQTHNNPLTYLFSTPNLDVCRH